MQIHIGDNFLKIALVTGATSGIGYEISKALLPTHRVLGIGRTGTVPQEVEFIPCDIRNLGFLTYAIPWDKIDLLVNNAGILPLTPFLQQSLSEYSDIFNTNFRAVVFATKFVLPTMIKNGGHIINISSNCGLVASPGASIYGASKAAVISFTKSIAAEFGSKVRCNCICPGPTETNLTPEFGLLPDNVLKTIPLSRTAKPEEIAQIVLFLEKCKYVNGATIVVDGGQNQGVFKIW